MIKGVKQIDIGELMDTIKQKRTKRNIKLIQQDPAVGQARLIDYNQIESILITSFLLKTIKLFMVIFTFSFYSGIIFKILVEIEKDLWFDDPEYEEETCYDWGGYFMECYGIGHGHLKDNAYDTTIIFLYFSFTSLTTVGFGDYHAKSNLERLVMAFFLLFGVAIFSYIMGIFLEILTQFKDLNADLN